jgi:hypothetical protein
MSRTVIPSRLLLTIGSALLLLGATPAVAADKSAYSLANPTPDNLLRELATDRPDATESPFTVDAGRIQVEMDFASFTRNRRDGTRSTEWGVAPFNFRLGLCQNIEAGIFVTPYLRQTETPRGGPREKHSGFGDVTLRGKFNFSGNDGGETAFGLIADLSLPVASGGVGADHTEGAVLLPVAFELAGGWEGGAMTGAEFRSRGPGGGYTTVWINTVTLGHELAKNLSGYVELTSAAGDGTHAANFNCGLALKLNAHTQLDCGANFGISRAADDVGLFVGLSRRF